MMATRRSFLRASALLTASAWLAACSPAQTVGDESDYEILADGLEFAEGPAFDPSGGLWCTEVQGGNIVHVDGSTLTRFPVGGAKGGRANSMIFLADGTAIVADSGRNVIYAYDPAKDAWRALLDSVAGHALQAPNDLTRDTRGNILFSCPNYASETATGYVVCLAADGTANVIAEGMHRPNGLDILLHEGTEDLIVADTYSKILTRGRWDALNRIWKDPQPWASVGGAEGPDGMAVDADGLVYQAIYGDGVIRVVDADGKVQRELAVPGKNPTNVAIDPSGKLGLVVTEAEKGQLISFPNLKPKAQRIP